MGRRDAVQVTLEIVAEMRRLIPNLVVTYEPGWETRGNGTSANYDFGTWHHTASNTSASNPFPTQKLLRDGRSDLSGPLCNEAVPWCTVEMPRLHVNAANPANHAGASRKSGPVPALALFNPRTRGLEIDYSGAVRMTAGQEMVAKAWGHAVAKVVGGGDIEHIRAHFETSVTGKIDISWGLKAGQNYDMAAFRRDAANFATAAPAPRIEDDDMKIIQSTNRGIALVGPNYYRGLTSNEEVEQAVNLWGPPVIGNDRQFDLWVSMATGGESADSKEIVGVGHRVENTEAAVAALAASVASRPATSGSVGAGQAIDIKELAAEIVALQNQQARDGDPATGPIS